MGKGTIIAIAIAVVVVLGGAGFFLMNKNSAQKTSPTTNTEETTDNNTKTSSLFDLMNIAQNQMCTYTDPDTGSEGTVYVAGEKVRGDFSTTVNDTLTSSHVIVMGEDMYMWNEGSNQGFKFSASETQNTEGDYEQYSQSTESSTVDVTKQINYKCNSWVVDDSKFNLPSGVDFQDFRSMMQETTESMQEESGVDCSTCDSLPAGESQNQCMQALGC